MITYVSLAQISTLIIAHGLLLKHRTPYFPRLPIFVSITFPQSFFRFLWAFAIVIASVLCFHPTSTTSAILLCAWSVLVIILDEHMICPQLVHFVVATMAICFESLDHLRMYTCLLYTLGGLQKLNIHFCTHGWLNFFRDILYIRFGWIAPRRTSFVFGFAAAMFETCCGLCLCVPNLASFAALHLILLHVAILTSVVGANTYQPIWPWNILCIILLYNLFVSNQRNENFWGVPSVSSLSECLVLCLEICLFLIGPLLSWIELWPPNLSFQMHSYNFADVRMIVNGKDFPFSDVALNYHTQPSLTFRGFSMWAQYLADFTQKDVKLIYRGRPESFSGKRRRNVVIFTAAQWFFS